jgi:hypothetical protein
MMFFCSVGFFRRYKLTFALKAFYDDQTQLAQGKRVALKWI